MIHRGGWSRHQHRIWTSAWDRVVTEYGPKTVEEKLYRGMSVLKMSWIVVSER